MDNRDLFEDNLTLIEQIVRFVCRRQGFATDEAEDFRSSVHLKLIDQDYAVFRKFEGKSSLKTYLVTVINRLGLDYRIGKWGKWRPSKKALRLGPTALELEQLLYRDGRTMEEAVEILGNRRPQDDRRHLEDLAAQLPVRVKRRFEDEDQLRDLPHQSPQPDQAFEQKVTGEAVAAARRELDGALQTLDAEDRLIVRMRYTEGLAVSAIARALSLEQKPLYRRLNQLLKRLRNELESRGTTAAQIQGLFEEQGR